MNDIPDRNRPVRNCACVQYLTPPSMFVCISKRMHVNSCRMGGYFLFVVILYYVKVFGRLPSDNMFIFGQNFFNLCRVFKMLIG